MKKCTKCQKLKELSEFNKNKGRKDGLQSNCRECSRRISRNYYNNNQEKMKSQINEARVKRRDSIRIYMFNHLSQNPCVDCGESDPRVLEFDHLRDKEHNVSGMIRNGNSLDKVKEEIAKCEVRCANCHRRKTAIEQNWYTHTLLQD